MKMIAKVAYLKICPKCGHHAWVVCADATKSDEFATKKRGLEIVDEFLQDGAIAKDEALFLQQQIAETRFPLEDRQLDEMVDLLYNTPACGQFETSTPRSAGKEKSKLH
jgi:hypothetical protein